MPTQPESRVVARFFRLATDKLAGCWAVKIHGGPYQQRGLPDIVGVHDGLFFAIECKRDLTCTIDLLQEYVLEQISAAGGLAIVAYGMEGIEQAVNLIACGRASNDEA